MTDEPRSTLHATCTAAYLSAALRAVLPHVAKDAGHRPALVGVGLDLTRGTLVVQASDATTMAVYRFDAVGGGHAVWTAASAKAAMTWAKGLDGSVEIDGASLVAEDGSICQVDLIDELYPALDGIVDAWVQRPPAGGPGAVVLGVDPALLGRFSRIDLSQHPDDKGHQLLLRVTGGQQPVHVAYGDHFTGLLAVA